jgi:trehalose 6-phosphate synthase/phosphatase
MSAFSEVVLTPEDHVIVIAYHLPLRVQRAAAGGYIIEWDDERGIDRESMGLPTRCTYIGCIELDVPDIGEQEALEKMLFEKYDSIVIFLDPEQRNKFYHGFCREYLAPLMHGQMHVVEDSDPFKREEWTAYCSVNQLFASKVVEIYGGSEIIWVHDYHLMLTPSCIVRKLPLTKIGFFLHASFPASDVWRSCAVRLELLRSLLNVDLVGFLMFEYTRNFLTCCKRMLGLEYEFQKGGFLGVEYEGRHVMAQVCTFGISPRMYQRRLEAPEFSQPSNAGPGTLWDVCGRGNIVIGAIDYLDRLKGVAGKLLAWEVLLRDYPHYRRGHVLVQVCVGARNRIQIKTAPTVEAELRRIVDRINAAYPGTVHFEVRSRMTPTERLQLWCASQILLVTALREAINVYPLEFVLARHMRSLPPGTLILSEFTGFARVLNGCLRINPNCQTEVVETLDAALTMSPEERDARAAKDLATITSCTNEAFASRFLRELKSTKTKRQEDFVCVGFGLSKFRLVGMGSGFKPLDTSEAIESFQKATRRVLLLDWGGTITAPTSGFYDQRNADAGLPQNVLDALGSLCAQPDCHVMIMSGLPKERVLAAFGTVPNLSLAVEHGFTFRVGDGEWQQLVHGVHDEWRGVARSVMHVYATRTHGAFVQDKGSSMLWNFEESDQEFGYMQGKELQTTLQQVLSEFPVVVRTGKGYVEACHRDINKGAMASHMIDLLQSDGTNCEFVLCAGDDSTDELMFAALNKKLGKGSPRLFTVTIGRKPSEASRYLDDHREVVELLQLLCTVGFRAPGTALGGGGGRGGGGMGMKKSGASLGGMGGRASFNDLASLG